MERSFEGFERPDGQVGIRNWVGIVSAMDNINPVTRAVYSAVLGTIPITTLFVRGQYGVDGEVAYRTLAGLGRNPNLAAVLVVGLEPVTTNLIADRIRDSGKPVETVVVAEVGSVQATAVGTSIARRMVIEASRLRRRPFPLARLTIGVECGGSDTTSGIAANPAIGHVSDRIVASGGSIVISETSEFIGAEELFATQAVTPEVADEFLRRIRRLEAGSIARGVDIRRVNPVPDNIRGGLTTLEEKSLGAMAKAGTSPLVSVLDYAERPSQAGLHFMDTPAPAVESLTGLAAGGCQLILFATGVGNPIGNTVAPTIKLSANTRTLKMLADNLDFDASAVLETGATVQAVGEDLLKFSLDIASGTLTCCEVLGQQEIAVSRFEPSS